jgi:hypothetical protein
MIEGLRRLLKKEEVMDGVVLEKPIETRYFPKSNTYSELLNQGFSMQYNILKTPCYYVDTPKGIKNIPRDSGDFEIKEQVRVVETTYLCNLPILFGIPKSVRLEKKN